VRVVTLKLVQAVARCLRQSTAERLDGFTHTHLPILEPPLESHQILGHSSYSSEAHIDGGRNACLALRLATAVPLSLFPGPQAHCPTQRRSADHDRTTAAQGLVLSLVEWKVGEAEVEFEDNGVSLTCQVTSRVLLINPFDIRVGIAQQLDLFPDCVFVLAKRLAGRPLRARYTGTEQGIII
jgi:hypothetical protein